MDKSWIKADRDSLQYEIGVENFLIFAEDNAKNPKKIRCPCARCVNFKKFPVDIIRGHLYDSGFSLGYFEWIWHGEEVCNSTKLAVGSSSPKVPKGFNLLYKHAATWMKTTGVSIKIKCEKEVFGVQKIIYVLHENVVSLLEYKMLGQAVIASYMA